MNAKPRVFVTAWLPEQILQPLYQAAEVEVWPESQGPKLEKLIEKAQVMDGLLTMLVDPINASLINAAGPQLKVISQMAVGYDNIDINAASLRKIPVGHTPGVLTETCADLTFGLLLAAARRIVEGDHDVRAGIWPKWGLFVLTGPEVYESTLGLVGFGRIGRAVARRAAGFGMRILYHDPKRDLEAERELGAVPVDLDTLLAEADFVSVHTYLSAETRGMFNRDLFAKMKPEAIFINTSRGGVVDSQALIWALQEKKIAGAAIDVFDPEPIQTDSPLLGMRNVVITPHIASASKQTRLRMAEISVTNLIAGIKGEKVPFCANPQVYSGG